MIHNIRLFIVSLLLTKKEKQILENGLMKILSYSPGYMESILSHVQIIRLTHWIQPFNRKSKLKPWMEVLLLAALILLSFGVFAKPPGRMKPDRQTSSVYWSGKKKTVTGKHTYHVRGFGGRSTCETYNTLPIQDIFFKRYHYERQEREMPRRKLKSRRR